MAATFIRFLHKNIGQCEWQCAVNTVKCRYIVVFNLCFVFLFYVCLHLLGGSETFQDKVNFFQRELRHIHSKRPRTKTCLKISRHSLLESVSTSGRSFLMGQTEQYRKIEQVSQYSYKPAALHHLFIGFFFCFFFFFFGVVQSLNFMGIKSDTFSPFCQSLKVTRNFSVSDWSKNFEVVFQDEEGWLTN